jgi:hypothetical protein
MLASRNTLCSISLLALATVSCGGGGRNGMAGIAGGAAATGEGGLAPSGKGGAPAISGSSGTGSSGKSVGAGGGNGTAGSGVGGASGSSGSAGQSGNTSQGAQGGAGGNAAAGTGGTAPDAGAAGSSTCSTDACPAKAGVTIACEKRFMFGVNFAWVNFGSDFGGGAQGVAQNQARIAQDLKDMKDNGVDVIRWWMHPSMFDGGGVRFDSGGTPQALGGSELADIDAALTLAAEQSVHLKLTLFSFDNFKPDSGSGHSLSPVIADSAKRKALIDNVVRPIARAVAGSANAARVVSWDVINEPEWAIKGSDGYSDPAFDAMSSLQQVDFAVMETFVREVVAALHDESKALVTVGQAAIKWSHAFTKVGLDYYDMHYYGWVDQYFPLGQKSLQDYGVGDKPVVVGEFPLDGWTNPNGTLSANQIVGKLFDLGYAGAKAWAFTQDGNWSANKGNLTSFASAHRCETQY